VGEHVAARTCDSGTHVVWTVESSAGATLLRAATVAPDGPHLVEGLSESFELELARPTLEPDCAIVAPTFQEGAAAFHRWGPGLTSSSTLRIDSPSAPEDRHAASGVTNLFLTVRSESLGVEVAACTNGAESLDGCSRTELGCTHVGGLAVDGDAVFFSCDAALYRWQPPG
jgi:hypothetical protein